MAFFEVTAKCGHVGRGRYYQGLFYVQAENGKAAAAIVRMIPRVKHDRKDAIIAVVKISYAVYRKGSAAQRRNPYFECHSNQEQCLIIAQITRDIHCETYNGNDKGRRHKFSDRRAKRNALLRYYRKMDKYYGHGIEGFGA
jgi:hypothetical protein